MPALSGNKGTDLKGNCIRSLNVRTRLAICVLASIGILFIQSWYPLTLLAAASLIYAAAHGRIKVIWTVYGAILAMFAIAMGCIKIMILFWPSLGDEGLAPFINPFLRIIVLANAVLALALSSRTREVMTALKSLKLPFFIYLPATVMIRFIPGFINDVRQIAQSMKTKGYSLNMVSLARHPILSMRLLFVPVVIRALRSSDELSVAAELKGLGYTNRLTGAEYHSPGKADVLALILAFSLIGVSVL
jgi:energy-coupling factor transport system permease protein